MRLFVAVLLPDTVRAVIAAEVERLRPLAHGVAWVAEANLHVTLKFLGEVDDARVEAVREALGRASAGAAPFSLEVSGIGAFPTAMRPRVLWAGLGAGAAALAAIAGRVDAALAQAGFPPEDRPFAGHVTLGRIREPRRDPALTAALERAARQHFGTVLVDRVVLVRSELSPNGSRYTEVDSSRLAAS